ncbi:MAG TPA: 50S ribosomal protein L25 [Planctomycetota bacterium]
MAEKVSLKAEKREALGTRVSRRFRLSGKIPAVLARKGDAPAHLLVDAREFGKVLKKHVRVIELAHPAGTDKVFLKEIQYDHLAEHVIHIDFTRIAKDELLTVEVALTLKGKPVGVSDEGGVLDQYVKVLKLQCLPDAIPDQIVVDVTGLKKDVKFTIKDIPLPAGVKALQDADLLVAIVQEHKVEEVAPAVAALPGALEPEVIKKEKAEDAEAEKGEKGAEKKDAPKKEEKK